MLPLYQQIRDLATLVTIIRLYRRKG